MKSPAKAYQDNKRSNPKMGSEAYSFFFNKYFKDPYQDKGFLDSTERLKAKNLKQFIPGKIYTFQYDPLHKDILDYYDKRPIILVCGQWVAKSTGNTIVTGINLNFLPEIAKVNTLEYYYQSVKDDLDSAYKITTETDQVSFIKRALIVLQDLVQTFNIFNKAGQIGYQFAMRNYIVSDRIKQPVLVEYDDWEWIPFLQTKDIVGKSLGEIQKEYMEQKNALAKKQPPIITSTAKKRKYTNR
jgi:hypothetical protein